MTTLSPARLHQRINAYSVSSSVDETCLPGQVPNTASSSSLMTIYEEDENATYKRDVLACANKILKCPDLEKVPHKTITTLHLQNCCFKNDSLQLLGNFVSVTDLDLSNSESERPKFSWLLRLTELKKVNFAFWDAIDIPEGCKGSLTKLQSVNCSSVSDLDDRQVERLCRLPKLEEVDLSGPTSITQKCLQFLSSVKGLKRLLIGPCHQIGTDAVSAFLEAVVRNKVPLQLLDFSNALFLEDVFFKRLCEVDTLLVLRLKGCLSLTGKYFHLTPRKVTELDISGCRGVYAENLLGLSNASSLKRVYLRNFVVTTKVCETLSFVQTNRKKLRFGDIKFFFDEEGLIKSLENMTLEAEKPKKESSSTALIEAVPL